MSRLLLLSVLGVCVAMAVASAGSTQTQTPSLRLVTLAPLTLRGAGFQARERVRVTLTVRALRGGRTFHADPLGRFTYRPQVLIALDPCLGTIVVRAVGLASSRQATWKRACRPPETSP
jgi:hypothetical protein